VSSDKKQKTEELDISSLTPEQGEAILDALSIPAKIEAEEHRKRREEQEKNAGIHFIGLGS
jgi:hypothetical protein